MLLILFYVSFYEFYYLIWVFITNYIVEGLYCKIMNLKFLLLP